MRADQTHRQHWFDRWAQRRAFACGLQCFETLALRTRPRAYAASCRDRASTSSLSRRPGSDGDVGQGRADQRHRRQCATSRRYQVSALHMLTLLKQGLPRSGSTSRSRPRGLRSATRFPRNQHRTGRRLTKRVIDRVIRRRPLRHLIRQDMVDITNFPIAAKGIAR